MCFLHVCLIFSYSHHTLHERATVSCQVVKIEER